MDFSLRLLRATASVLSPAGRRARLVILAFHRIIARPDPLLRGESDVDQLRMQLEALTRCFNVLPLGEACRAMAAGKLPARAACLTFDDGYATNASIALPVLREFDVCGTFFVATGFLNGGRMFNDTVIESVRRMDTHVDLGALGLGAYELETDRARLALIDEILRHIKYMQPAQREEWAAELAAGVESPLPQDLMMTDAQVRELHAAGMEIGGHTVTHPILARIETDEARREIAAGREHLQSLTGAPVESFAYPNGKPEVDYRAEHVDLLRQTGYRQAVSTAWGVAGRRSDIYQLPRIGSWDRDARRFVARILRAYTQGPALTV